MIILSVLGYLLLAYLILSAMTPFLLSMAAATLPTRSHKSASKLRKFLVLIPAYKEDAVIVKTAKLALDQDYPSSMYDVVIIADSLKEETLLKLSQLEVIVHKVSFKKSTKVKALNHALERLLTPDYEGTVILDADNVMDSRFLTKMNDGLDLGMRAIQGQRKAKNSDTSMAFLDGASEDINNHIYCKGAYKTGLSSRLAGSGMAFDPKVLVEALQMSEAIGGFDKELELYLTRKGMRIHYLEDAIVFDEKVSHGKAFSNQRSRWIQAQYKYLAINIKKGLWQGIVKGNADYVHKIMVLALPPRLLFPFILFSISLVWTIIMGFNEVAIVLWSLWLVNIMTFIIALPPFYFKRENLTKWTSLFNALFQTVKAIGKLSKAKSTFIHTPHNS